MHATHLQLNLCWVRGHLTVSTLMFNAAITLWSEGRSAGLLGATVARTSSAHHLHPPAMAPPVPDVDEAYWDATEQCIVCGDTDFVPGYGPRTLVFCDCCLDKGVHVECWHKHQGELLSEERLASSAFQWFCSEVGSRVHPGVRGRRQDSNCGGVHATAAAAASPVCCGGCCRPASEVCASFILRRGRSALGAWLNHILTASPVHSAAQGCRHVSEQLVELTGVPRALQGQGGGDSEYRCARQVGAECHAEC